MKRWRVATAASISILALASCHGRTPRSRTAAPVLEQSKLINDQTNGGGKTGFYWIPPIVSAAATFTTIDQTGGSNGLTVKVDKLFTDNTTSAVTSFTGTGIKLVTGTSDTGFPGVVGPFYGATWAPGSGVVSGEVYRISIQALTPLRVLGVADVQVVANATAAAAVDRTKFTPLIVGNSLSIVFRLESKDTDGDTLNDWQDNCPVTKNVNQLDSDADGRGDACQCLNVPNGTACSTGCKTSMTCQSGACTGGTSVTNGTSCSTGNLCKMTETCTSGVCGGGANKTGSCSTGNPCKTTETCTSGVCGGGTNKTGSCSTGNPCKTTETCTSGVCGGGTNKTGSCSTGNPCKTGETCTTGTCGGGSNATNGTACGDGNLCTQTDTCQSGICTGASPITCVSDGCHNSGTCDKTLGVCPARKTNGTTCASGNSCKTAETCTSGVCGGGSNVTNGTTCNDANACTTGETCQSGACSGGSAVTCTADQCHTVGVCVAATGCPAPQAKADGTTCNDSSMCTTGDACTAGICTGATVTCTTDTCHTVGACVAATGCPLPQPKANGTDLQRRQRLHDGRDVSVGRLLGRLGGDVYDGPVPHDRRVRPGDGLPGGPAQDQRHDLQRQQPVHDWRHVPIGDVHGRGGDVHDGPVPHYRGVRRGDGLPGGPAQDERHDLQRRQRLHDGGGLSVGNLRWRHGGDVHDRPVPHHRGVRGGDGLPGSSTQGERDSLQRQQPVHDGRRLPGRDLHGHDGDLHDRCVSHGGGLRRGDGLPDTGLQGERDDLRLRQPLQDERDLHERHLRRRQQQDQRHHLRQQCLQDRPDVHDRRLRRRQQRNQRHHLQ